MAPGHLFEFSHAKITEIKAEGCQVAPHNKEELNSKGKSVMNKRNEGTGSQEDARGLDFLPCDPFLGLPNHQQSW